MKMAKVAACAVMLATCRLGIGHALASDSAESDSITVDTRASAALVALVITGPSSVAAGTKTDYTCTAQYSDGMSVDVTAECDWWATDTDGTGTTMWGNKLAAGAPSSTIIVHLHAAYARSNGRVVTDPFAVWISRGLHVQLAAPVVQNEPNQWRLTLTALVHNEAGSIHYRWFMDEVEIAGQQDDSLDHVVIGEAGKRKVRVTVTDGSGLNAEASCSVTFNKPPAVNQPPVKYTASPPTAGSFIDENGAEFEFDSSKIANGLIVLTHGLSWGGSPEEWLKSMAFEIRDRLQRKNMPVPNIAIYLWPDGSNPSDYYDTDDWWIAVNWWGVGRSLT